MTPQTDRQEHWQEIGKGLRGGAFYHVTLAVADGRPLLGQLDVPGNDVASAHVVHTPLGKALEDSLVAISAQHPEVKVLYSCLAPDCLHVVLFMGLTLGKGIGTVVRGFWQTAKKLGRACSAAQVKAGAEPYTSFINIGTDEGKLAEESRALQQAAATLRSQKGIEAYYRLDPLFAEKPIVQPIRRRSQLPNVVSYLDMCAQRLAAKRLMPGLFCVQRGIVIGGHTYSGVGNVELLLEKHYAPVHVRHVMVSLATYGNNSQPLRNYKNMCVLKARRGVVMVSPFISQHEKQVMQVLQREHHPFILLADNGFLDYYSPSDALFTDCANDRLLILSPWPHDDKRQRISRADCLALNAMAEEICSKLNDE